MPSAQITAATIEVSGPAFPPDVTNTGFFESFLSEAKTTIADLDILINSAGVMSFEHFLHAGRTAAAGDLNYCDLQAGILHRTEGARLELGYCGVDSECAMQDFTNFEPAAGTPKSARFISHVEPGDAAEDTINGIERNSRNFSSPKVLRATYGMRADMGRQLRDVMYPSLDACATFMEIHSADRAVYNERVRRS